MASLGVMINQLEGLLGTDDLSDWETRFVENVVHLANKSGTPALSTKQVETVERIWRRHFA